jgi:TP901 family phage tail tape measure protein
MTIAELFAKLGLKPDKRSFDVGSKMLEGIKGQLAGIAALSSAITFTKTSLDFSKSLTDLDIASQGAMGSVEEVRKQILAVSDETGIAKEELLSGASAFVALTGDGKAAAASLDTFARVTKATGAEMADVTRAASAMKQNLGIDSKDFERAFSILIQGGKQGAVELKDMAGQLAILAPLANQFAGGGGIEGLAKLGAGFQLAMQGFGTASQAATGMEALMGSIVSNAKRFEKSGVKVFTKDAQTGRKVLREFDAIINEIGKSKLVNDPTALTAAFGSKEAYAAFLQLTKVDGAWEDLIQKTLKADDVAQDYAKRQASDSAKILKAWNRFSNTMERVFGVVVKGLAWMTDHIDLVLVAIGSIALALLIVKGAAVASAIASAAAWVRALLPFIAIAAAIAALILIIEDLYRWFSGGESVFKQLYESAKKWIDEKLGAILDDAEKRLAGFLFGDYGKKIAERNAAGRKSERDRVQFEEKKRQDTEALPLAEREERLKRQINRLNARYEQAGIGGNTDKAALGNTIAKLRAELHQVQDAQRAPAAQANSSQFNANITVNAPPGADAQGIADATAGSVKDLWDAQMRDASAATAR